jgi:hypothetical protein
MCSYFTDFSDSKAQEDATRARRIRCYKEVCDLGVSGRPEKAPPSHRYFVNIVERLQRVRPEDLTENSVLLDSPAQIAETSQERRGRLDEVILYFNVGPKPHTQVNEEMGRFRGRRGYQTPKSHRQPLGCALLLVPDCITHYNRSSPYG